MKRQDKRIEVNELRSDTQIQDQERTHTRDNESGAGFQTDHERRLEWYGRVMRRDEEHILRKVLPYLDLTFQGKCSYTISWHIATIAAYYKCVTRYLQDAETNHQRVLRSIINWLLEFSGISFGCCF